MRRTTKILSLALALAMILSAASAFADTTENDSIYNEICTIADSVNVGEKDESFTGNINIYMNWGTVSPLYSLLNVFMDIDEAKKNGTEPTKSFMWYERPSTADEKLLPENVTLMNDIDEKYNSGKLNAENTKKCMGYVKKVYETYPNAHYTLFTDDLRAQYELCLMTYNGIPESQYNVILGSDGIASYTTMNSYLLSGLDQDKVGESTEESGKFNDKWNYYAYWYHEYKKRMANHDFWDQRFLNSNGGGTYIMWEEASQDNVEYWIQWPQLLKVNVGGLQELLNEKMNLVEKHHNDMYASLSDKSKEDFLNLVLAGAFKGSDYPEGTNFKELYDTTYMPGYADKSKKYMIISGTSQAGEGDTTGKNFEARVDAVIKEFGDEYTYLYKPHPRWPASSIQGRQEYLDSKGIVELPAQTPMEVLLWTYPEVYVGGYSSSLYMSATTKGQVKFFLAAGPKSLSDPLPAIYDLGYFDDAVFFNPDPIKNTPEPSAEPTIKPSSEPNGFSVKYAEGNAEVKVPENGTYCVVFASYKDGALAGIKTITKEFNAGTETVTPEGFSETDTDNVKVMLWDTVNSLSPKCVSDSKNK